ncbi:hypothetical protein [Klebsiella pneumoniae]|uniref:hypothetical protein n=1 Tax=Klebsiella pneumoniae TaxID=573 RepID=UPI001D18BE91|nr:hypothetical protein [Klebsiella pneumoniae]
MVILSVTRLQLLNNKVDGLISQQRDGWAHDRLMLCMKLIHVQGAKRGTSFGSPGCPESEINVKIKVIFGARKKARKNNINFQLILNLSVNNPVLVACIFEFPARFDPGPKFECSAKSEIFVFSGDFG